MSKRNSCITFIVWITFTQSLLLADNVRNLNEMQQQMAQLGKPAMLIAGNEGCIYCRKMAQQLATVPELQPLQKQFAILKIDSSTPTWAAARRALKFEGTGIPAVFIFRADGKELYSKSGMPQDLAAFMKRYLEQAGQILPPRAAEALSKDWAKLQPALKRNQLDRIITISGNYELEDSFAKAAIEMTKVQKQVTEQVNDQLADLEMKVKASPEDLDSITQIIKLQQLCKPAKILEDQAKTVNSILETVEVKEELITQAELLLEADNFRRENRKSKAKQLYADIVKRYPRTEAARIAQERLGDKTISSNNAPATTPSKSADVKKAESYLRLGKRLLEKNSPNAKKYLQKAIEAAPNSKAAAEAKALLN